MRERSLTEEIKTAEKYMSEKKFKDACTVFEKIHDSIHFEDAVDANSFLKYHILYGEALLKSGDLIKSNEIFGEGLRPMNAQDSRTEILTAELLNDCAYTEDMLGFFAESEKKYLESKILYEKNGCDSRLNYLHVLVNLANLYKRMFVFDKAEKLFNAAVLIIGKNGECPENVLDIVKNNTAGLYIKMGLFEKSERIYFDVMKMRARSYGYKSAKYAEVLNNLAFLYTEMNPEIADPIYCKSLKICEELFNEKDLRIAKTRLNLARLRLRKRRYDGVYELISSSIGIFTEKSGSRSLSLWDAKLQLAELYWKTGMERDAAVLYDEIENYYALNKNLYVSENIKFLIKFSQFSFFTGNTDKGIACLKEALKEQNKIFWNVIKGLPEDSSLQFLDNLIESSGFAVSSLLNYADSISKADFEELYTLIFARKGMVFEVSFLHRMKNFMEGKIDLKRKYEEYKAKRNEYAARAIQGYMGTESEESYLRRQNELLEGILLLEKELLESVDNDQLSIEEKNSLELLRKKLAPDELVFDYYKFKKYDFKTGEFRDEFGYCMFFISGAEDKPDIRLKYIGDSGNIDEKINEYRNSIDSDENSRGTGKTRLTGINQIIGHSKELYEKLTCNLAEEIILSDKDEIIRHCYICPDGEISKIPFESLISDSEEFFIDRNSVSYCNSVRDVYSIGQRNTKIKNIMIFANPEYELPEDDIIKTQKSESPDESRISYNCLLDILDGSFGDEHFFTQLDGSEEEADIIENILSHGKVKIEGKYTKRQVNKSRIKKIHSPSILHIATHGFFIEDTGKEMPHPLFHSGLVLSGVNSILHGKKISPEYENGVLFAYDTNALDLRETEMVVLSGCETGLGKTKNGEGILGFRRSFIQAGARTLIMSLWRVSDKHTSILMESFYLNLLKGEKIPQALRSAQIELIDTLEDSFGFAPPMLWAGFVCMGSVEKIEL